MKHNEKYESSPSRLQVVECPPNGSSFASPKEKLQEYLKSLPSGTVKLPRPVEVLLAEAWDELDGSDEGGMRAWKIPGRCEGLSWEDPVITFIIERHGATINGSSRAELQHWSVNPSSGNACIYKRGRRQLYPMSKRLDVYKLATEVADDILNERQLPKLKWYPDGRVKIVPKEIIPETNAQTTTSRRRRFREVLVPLLAAKGWGEISLHTYRRNEVK